MKCIFVTLSDGTVARVTVDDDVTELPPEDLTALEKYQAIRRERAKKQA